METLELITSRYLSDLQTGDEAFIIKINGQGAFRKRITEMGFVKGKRVKVIKNAPLLDPVEYEIMGYNVSLRRSEARMIETIPLEQAGYFRDAPFEGTLDELIPFVNHRDKTKTIRVALVGNPNSGKTTLYNYASGSREHVGNYGGVTVDAREARFRKGEYTFQITDLPGTYSITEYTPEELFVRNHIARNKPDVVINVIDASNLERNLFLTTQLIDLQINVVIALNMYDELEQKGDKFNYQQLSQMIGIPIIPTVASKGKGISNLFNEIIEVYEGRNPIVRPIRINYGIEPETSINIIQEILEKNPKIAGSFPSRYLAIKLLEDDQATFQQLANELNIEEIKRICSTEKAKLERQFNEKSQTVITDAKYAFIAGALKETYETSRQVRRKRTARIDDFMTHRYLGFPIFIFMMWLMFQATFTLGSFPMDWIDGGIKTIGHLISQWMPAGMLKDLLVDGIIGGVGGVIIFLPNIMILFFFISLMEDSGYMARTSFIMDKLMHKIGLHGKSFIPLVMGFGCNVPAIMATRTLENRKDRILTMLIAPFMSCSARLPVYVLLISAFFPSHQGSMLFLIYVIGVILAVLVGLTLKQTLFSKKDVPFVMELPPYRIPTLKSTTIHMWNKAVQYLKKMGSVILIASILIWALGYFPKKVDYSQNYEKLINQTQQNSQLSESVKADKIKDFELLKESEHQEKSYIGQLGHWIEPMIKPLGFDWKIGVSILTGMAAKEIVVSTMGVLYQVNPGDDQSQSLVTKLQQQTHVGGELHGKKVFSQLTAFTMMLFVLIYFPCIAVIAAIRKESNWKWAVFTMFYTTAMAWIIAFITYQAGSLLL